MLLYKEPNTYKYHTFCGPGWYPMPTPALDLIVFKDESNTGISLPDGRLIRLHRALAHILHVSGAGEDIDRILKEMADAGASKKAAVHTGEGLVSLLEVREAAMQLVQGIRVVESNS